MSESVTPFPLVYNPDLINYPKSKIELSPEQGKTLQQVVDQFLTFKKLGVIGADQLDLSDNGGLRVIQNGNNLVFPSHPLNSCLKQDKGLQYKPSMKSAEIDFENLPSNTKSWGKLLYKLIEKLQNFNNPPTNKRFGVTVLLHEDLHRRLELEGFDNTLPFDLKEEYGLSFPAVSPEYLERVKQRMTKANVKRKVVMRELSTKGFTKDQVRKLITRYFSGNAEEFFTTSMEAIVQLKCRQEITPPIAKELGFPTIEEAKAFLHEKLAHYTEVEAKLTNALKEECSKVSPAFKDMMSKIDTHWDDVAPLLLKHFKKVI
jgi:hypothetical protein